MKRLIWCALIAAGAAYGAEPPKDWQGWTLQPDGCNYCSATECTAMSCLPISERRSAGPPPMSTHAVCGGSVSGEWETWEPRSNGECSKDDAPSEHKWHVLVQTYGGTVSLIKDLTKHEADFISKRLLGQPATPQEERDAKKRDELCAALEKKPGAANKLISGCSTMSMTGPGTIISAEVFQ